MIQLFPPTFFRGTRRTLPDVFHQVLLHIHTQHGEENVRLVVKIQCINVSSDQESLSQSLVFLQRATTR